MNKKESIVKYRNPFRFNIGSVIFFIIILYVAFNVFTYFTKKEIAGYQVQSGAITNDRTFQGLILREESLIYAAEEGYIDYYPKNATKTAASDLVYSIDQVGAISNAMAASARQTKMTDETVLAIHKRIDQFLNSYDSNRFQDASSFLQAIDSEIVYSSNNAAIETFAQEIALAEKQNTFRKYSAGKDGIILFEMDGYEGKTEEELLESGWSEIGYEKTYFTSNRKVDTSSVAYKQIRSEKWTILVPIDEETALELNSKSSVTIRFCKDDFTTTASCGILKKNGTYYAKLTLNTGVIRYATDRFIEIEIVTRSINGLKIPTTAITTKEFFTIPKEYFTHQKNGLLIRETDEKTGETTVRQVYPTVYYSSDTYYYIDDESVKAGDCILMPESQSVYVVGKETDKLQGVYNINKGYAVFKQINILYATSSYVIVETKTPYGISLYDHIALDASKVTEHELVVN